MVTVSVPVTIKVHRGLGDWAKVLVKTRELACAEGENVEKLLATFGLTSEDLEDAYALWYKRNGREAEEIAQLERAAGWDTKP